MSTDPIHIVVVDDNPASRYATAHVLRSVGWQISEAATGKSALALVDESVNLVVLDVNLPDMNGFEVCRQIRNNEKIARVPVVHLSATFVKDVDKVHGLDVGADGYLVHPVEPPVLIATVRAFLRARQAEQDREQMLIRERTARAEAERANRVKDEFLATLSHELRTPLHAIIGWAQVLRLGKVTEAESAEGLDAIVRNAQAQAQLIADLLDVSRITSGKIRLDVQPLDLAVTVEEATSAILPAADAKDIRITKVLDPHAGCVAGDPTRLQQVVWNLVNNAVKFTPRGGKVQVTLARINSHVEIAVADSGQGIDAELLPRIFERFWQGDASTTREHGGLGLGLAIAKQLIELHGGTIRAESTGPGHGSRFAVTLPLSAAEQYRELTEEISDEESHKYSFPIDATRLDGLRVLLVDDDNDARRVLMRILQISGADTREAGSVKEAIDAMTDFRPEILVSDLGMPEQDGFALIQQVRASGRTFQQLPAIALTGFARPEDRRRALLAGFQLHITKPVDPHELTAAIAALVGRIGD